MVFHSNLELKLLLVDDDEDEYILIKSMLSVFGGRYVLTWSPSYADALSKIRQESFDVYLLDYLLGDQNGLDLINHLGSPIGNLPIIVMTAQSKPGLDLEALRYGATDYLNKNKLDIETLERTIRYAYERSQNIHQLRRSEERYRAIVQAQTELLVLFDPKGRLTFINEPFARFFNSTVSQLLGAVFSEYVAPSSHKKLQIALQRLSPVTPISVVELQMQNETDKDEMNTIYHQWNFRALYDEANRLIEYQGVGTDITERKRTESKLNQRIQELNVLQALEVELTQTLNIDSVLSLAVDSAMRLSKADIASVMLFDEEGNPMITRTLGGIPDQPPPNVLAHGETNGMVRRALGSSEAVLLFRSDHDPNFSPSNERVQGQMIVPLVSQERLVGMIDLETQKAERFTHEIFNLIRLIAARIAAALDNARLYDQARTQLEELRMLYKQISDLEQLKTDMIRIAAHDLRNPLGVMQGYIEMMLMDFQDFSPEEETASSVEIGRYRNYLMSMLRANDRMQKITRDILSLEKIEERLDTEHEPLDLTNVIRYAYYELVEQAKTKRQNFVLSIPDQPTYIIGDFTQLAEATVNLVNNAIKYTPEEGTIEISLEYDGDAAIFEAIDTGYGIPLEMQSRMFQPFYRVQTKETHQIEGTGLGLHLVKRIVERHHGRMIFRSTYGVGSTFGFQIPAIRPSKDR
ncbi:MAG: ATP-binding protein [Phototrophicaceae bacterium]